MLIDDRWSGYHGIGRFADEVIRRLDDVVLLKGNQKPLSLLDPVWLSRKIMKYKPDVYFSPGFNPPLFIDIPFVFTIHDLIHIRFKPETSIHKRIFYSSIIRRAISRAARILTVSEFTKQEIVNWTGIDSSKIVVCYNGISPAFNRHVKLYKDISPYFLYVGNLKKHKNIERILRAFSFLDSDEYSLIMVSECTNQISSLVESIGLKNRVKFVRNMSDDTLACYYKGAVALLMPSLYEGFGLPVVEAMACGTPVITSNVTSLPEIVSDAAILVDPYSIDDITAAMLKILSDKNLSMELSARGLERSKFFSWNKTAKIVLDVLNIAKKEQL